MAESHKFTSLDKAVEVYPDLPWSSSADNTVSVYDAKKGEYVPVEKGQYIVSIADRFEVADEEPAKAKPAEVKVEEDDDKSDK